MHHAQILSAHILSNFLATSAESMPRLLELAAFSEEQHLRAENITQELIEAIRHPESPLSTWLPHIDFDHFLKEYGLDSEEGIALMCLAEALLRIPDHTTAQALIEDKLGDKDWQSHIGHSDSFWINASSWGLLLTGSFFSTPSYGNPQKWFQNISHKMGDHLAEEAIRQAMKMIGEQFVAGKTIQAGLSHAEKEKAEGYTHSFDMLGEAALCQTDVERYTHAYAEAIRKVACECSANDFFDIIQQDSISIKLSALHPRYEFHQRKRVFAELLPRLKKLVSLAQSLNVPITIDAEESYRLELSLELFAALINDRQFAHWPYIGLAIQAYQKRALAVIDWLHALARRNNRRIPVRLVKGAYWDSEIKYAQQQGLQDYPVWTRKAHTDISYLACAHRLFQHGSSFYPQFATHNAQTVAALLCYGYQYPLVPYEFQRLHGMGGPLYAHLLHHSQRLKQHAGIRIYAPIGEQSELLAYLVRRLLENGANSSFVNAVNNEQSDMAALCRHPVKKIGAQIIQNETDIALPQALYSSLRTNSQGVNLQGQFHFNQLKEQMAPHLNLYTVWQAKPSALPTISPAAAFKPIFNPARINQQVGQYLEADETTCLAALDNADNAFSQWSRTPAEQRTSCLERMAELLEENKAELMSLLILEAGKTYENALDELRETVDFCRYYSQIYRDKFAQTQDLEGPTGESNQLRWLGKGVFLCISPWNFPLAIFAGQIAAALVSGNSVIAKPAASTPLIASRAIALFHAAGIPEAVLQFLPSDGQTLSNTLLKDSRVAGIAFTGSTETARLISMQLIQRPGPLPTIIAETGGQNAMIVDSSALPEQVVRDVIRSAFNSGGQRCSALRVLFIQDEIATHLISLLLGAMAELHVGDPADPACDLGPVINRQAETELNQHLQAMTTAGKLLGQTTVSEALKQQGYYVNPSLIEISSIAELKQEHFGPILHVIRYKSEQLDTVIESINNTLYGLTFGIHSRINSRIDKISAQIRAGNIYINRDMVGAVPGCQPFGGMGLSGTGPKAGGPHYLQRFATEVTVSTNTTAAGGNTRLLNAGKP